MAPKNPPPRPTTAPELTKVEWIGLKPPPPPAPPQPRIVRGDAPPLPVVDELRRLERNLMAAAIYGGSIVPGDMFANQELIRAAYLRADAMRLFVAMNLQDRALGKVVNPPGNSAPENPAPNT